MNPGHLDRAGMQGQGLSAGVDGGDHAEFLNGDGVDAASTVAGLSNRTSPTNEVLGAEREALNPRVARFLR